MSKPHFIFPVGKCDPLRSRHKGRITRQRDLSGSMPAPAGRSQNEGEKEGREGGREEGREVGR